jgi:hypothetical protein
MKLVQQTFDELTKGDDISVREKEQLAEIKLEAERQDAYNSIYDEAYPLAIAGEEMELSTFFVSIENDYLRAEAAYDEATAKKSKKAAELGIAYDKALLVYNAALDVEFDLEEAVRQAQLIPEVELDEDTTDALSKTILDARNNNDTTTVKALQKDKYDEVTRLEGELANDKQNTDIANDLAAAREEYDYVKRVVKETQTEEEKAAVPVAVEQAFQPKEILDVDEDTKKGIIAQVDKVYVATIPGGGQEAADL